MVQNYGALERVLRMGEGRRLKRLRDQAAYVTSIEPDFRSLSDADLAAKTAEFKQRIENGEELEDILFEAFAAVREAARRALGMRHFDVQVMGAIVLHEGDIAEMKTGEGKTLVATMPLYLNALTGRNVHLVTVNDYLAKRDTEWMGPVYEALGLRAAYIRNLMPFNERRDAYAADITYGTNSEFGFDYLRDNMATSLDATVQRGHTYAIVDEVDSILIDEARTPLIISGEPETAGKTYYDFARVAKTLAGTPVKIGAKGEDAYDGFDYTYDEKFKTVSPLEPAIEKVERALGIDNLYDPRNAQLVNHLIQALKAESLYHRDDDYVVIDGEVKIVDEFTGRIMEGRRWSEGLHQAVEAKERVPIKEEHVTLATITLQNYFRLYEKLAGMTGTAKTEEKEFQEIYDLSVVEIPTNEPMIREDKNDLIFKTKDAKFRAVMADIKERHDVGQPVLVGTISVEVSEHLSQLLTREGIRHNVLNAKQHEREAEIIKDAGVAGSVTIATNMAGRGVDIKLGEGVREVGGLYVLGTERHEARRIDNQLRGRSGRQGDRGESRFYLSAEDELVRLFAGDRIYNIIERFKLPEDEPMEAGILSKQIENAQKKVEEQNFVSRKNVLKYDDVMNVQRMTIYEQRRRVLEGEDLSEDIRTWIDELVDAIVRQHTESEYQEEWDLGALVSDLHSVYETQVRADELRDLATREELVAEVQDDARDAYAAKEEELGPELMREVERYLVLQVVDARWREHLDAMEYLREGIHLRAMAQKDPLSEYRAEGHALFQELAQTIREEVLRFLFHIEIEPEEAAQLQPAAANGGRDGNLVYEHESLAGSEAIQAATAAPAQA
ncbi:MAG: preprotein translocase subunit SecA, partial [Actinomycetota bacterium]|nr:preprotein translocase subunit SecA [Actinomycetota bacterium]